MSRSDAAGTKKPYLVVSGCGRKSFRAHFVRVRTASLTGVKRANRLNFLHSKREIEDVYVFGNSSRTYGFRNRRSAKLDLPPQYNLRGRFPVFLCERSQCRVSQRVTHPFPRSLHPVAIDAADGRPCLRYDSMPLIGIAKLTLTEEWVEFHLIHSGRMVSLLDELVEIIGTKIAHAIARTRPSARSFIAAL